MINKIEKSDPNNQYDCVKKVKTEIRAKEIFHIFY